MRVRGLDFTSAPSAAKPLTLAEACWDGHKLAVHEVLALPTFDHLRKQLAEPGPWRMGMDFPFGLPIAALQDWGLHCDWNEAMQRVLSWDKVTFCRRCREARSKYVGTDQSYRRTDRRVGAQSPLNIVRPAVGKMLYEGLRLMIPTGISIWPCRMNEDSRVALEAYPAAVAMAEDGSRSAYKADLDRRRALISRLPIEMPSSEICACMADPLGDRLDAVLAALQAARAPLGQPAPGDLAVEGSIVA